MSAIPATHLVPSGERRTTLCGIKLKDGAALPYVSVEHAQAHIAGRGMVVCPACEKVWKQ